MHNINLQLVENAICCESVQGTLYEQVKHSLHEVFSLPFTALDLMTLRVLDGLFDVGCMLVRRLTSGAVV